MSWNGAKRRYSGLRLDGDDLHALAVKTIQIVSMVLAMLILAVGAGLALRVFDLVKG